MLPLFSFQAKCLLVGGPSRVFYTPSIYLLCGNHSTGNRAQSMIRYFSSTRSYNLIYQPKAKVSKQKEPVAIDTKKKHLSISDAEDAAKDACLLKNKYYLRCPKILRPYLKEVMVRPVGFGFSIVILQQVFVVVPFLLLWYYYFQVGVEPDQSNENLKKGLDTIKKGLVNLDMDDESKLKMAIAGAASYALTKSLLPVRVPVCVALAPWFDKWCIRPIIRILTAVFKKNAVVKPRPRK
ncbi:hypothetical protein FOA43_000270 [Brettanomyces nanus]|uniref:Uncharacterized protein n=1 Tax=Eeniella nana TaxID=13502 RepID=A0A875RW44_EENNA|nr:uncharacterized protein FOA43_000270 [Brettanomyces nanus]QPG72966.1 hypothetical protein FOA43_000270 [Brettanomyces nanus]